MKYILITLIFLCSCNIYELVGDETKLSNDLKDAIVSGSQVMRFTDEPFYDFGDISVDEFHNFTIQSTTADTIVIDSVNSTNNSYFIFSDSNGCIGTPLTSYGFCDLPITAYSPPAEEIGYLIVKYNHNGKNKEVQVEMRSR